jgi:hypothetical protein
MFLDFPPGRGDVTLTRARRGDGIDALLEVVAGGGPALIVGRAEVDRKVIG